MPWTPMNTRSTWTVRRAATANGPTSASDGVRTPPVRMTVWSVRAAWWRTSATPDRVGHDGQARDVDQLLGEGVGRRSGRHGDRHPGLDERSGRPGDGVLLGLLEARLGGERRLEQGAALDRGRAAVDLLDEAAGRRAISRSRRTVISETPSSRTRSATRTAPSSRTRSRIFVCRCRASIIPPSSVPRPEPRRHVPGSRVARTIPAWTGAKSTKSHSEPWCATLKS